MTAFRFDRGVISPGTAANEKSYAAAPRTHQWDGTKRAVIVLPGHNGDALTTFSALSPFTPGEWGAIDAGLPVLCIDGGGGASWATDAAITRLEEAVAWIGASGFGKSDKVILIGTSMGSMLETAYIGKSATNRGKVAAAGLFYPSSLDYAYNNSGFAAEINTAYGNAAGYAAAKPTHDVIDLANAGKLNGVPIKGWYSTNDTTAGTSTWANIKAALLAGGATAPEEASLGAVGHGDNTLIPRAQVAAWLGAYT